MKHETESAGLGHGYGKTILIGDMFVFLGIPAIVSAIPQRTVASVRDGRASGWTLDDRRQEVPGYKDAKRVQQVESIHTILKVLDLADELRAGISIELSGDLVAGSGIGASAASCVALVRAANDRYGLGLVDEEVNHVAWQGEFAYHKRPSGIDNTAACYGGVMLFEQDPESERNHAGRLDLKHPIKIVLVNSGVTVDTSTKRLYLAELEKRDPSRFHAQLAEIRAQVAEMKNALLRGDVRGVGAIMNENHAILIEMGLSHPVIVDLARTAAEEGAWGAKVTGGGRGGYMLCLTPEPDVQERVATRFEQDGFVALRSEIGAA